MKKTEKHYFKDQELWKEIKISKGKGKRTKRLEEMLILLSFNISRKKMATTPNCDKNDILNEIILNVLINWKSFDYKKYDHAGPYITEVIKRAQVLAFNSITRRKKYSYQEVPILLNIDDWR